MGDIAGLVRGSTVAVVSAADVVLGSGFFVAPGCVLTCAHVVLDAPEPLRIRWNGSLIDVTAMTADPAERAGRRSLPPPDAALLTVAVAAEHPCVPLAPLGFEPAAGHQLQVFGYTRVRVGAMEPDGATPTFGGRVAEDAALIRLAGGQLAPGLSGGPVLHRDTGTVCAMTKAMLDTPGRAEGWAVPIDLALSVGDAATLRAANLTAFDDGLPALRGMQARLGPLPAYVAELVRPATAALAAELRVRGVNRPVTVVDADLTEWVARQLFVRTFDELLDLLYQAASLLGPVTSDVLHAVACCLPPGAADGPDWVSAEAVEALRLEWDRESPRVLRLASDRRETATIVLRRALQRKVPVLDVLPHSAEVRPDGLPVQVIADVERELQRVLEVPPASWARLRSAVLGRLRNQNHVARLGPEVLGDAAVLAGLRAAFGGLRFVVGSRDAPVPPGAGDELLDLQPPVDEDDEELALTFLAQFERTLNPGSRG